MKPHKHAELIKAWADGAEIEYRAFHRESGEWTEWKCQTDSSAWITNNELFIYEYRLKQEIPQWHKDIIQAINEGKEIQVFRNGDWIKSNIEIISWENPSYFGYYKESEYRIKPEPKPDWCMYLKRIDEHTWTEYLPTDNIQKGKVKLTFDGETGEPKSAEVLK